MKKNNLIDKPETFKVLDISTCHIASTDAAQLERGVSKKRLVNFPVVYDYGAGAFVFVTPDERQNYPTFSSSFNEIMEFARLKHYRFVCFDADGVIYPHLTQHEW